jgi:hypothetical protein
VKSFLDMEQRDAHIILIAAAALLLSVIGVLSIVSLRTSSNVSPLSRTEKRIPEFHHQYLSWVSATTTAEWGPRDSAASFIFRDRLWTMGGLNGNAVTDTQHAVQYWDAVHYNDIWSSADGREWKRETEHADWSPRRSMSVVFFNDALWMIGGWSPVDGYMHEVWKSTDGVNWEKVVTKAPWAAREGQSVEVFQNKLWLFGGVNYDDRKVFNDIWCSDDGITWYLATSSAPWSGRWDHATAQFHGVLFLIGGMDLSKQSFKDVWISDNGMTWDLLDDNPPWQDRQGHSLLVLHDALWLVSRLNDAESGGDNDIWYSMDGVTWLKTVVDPPWLGREDHAGLVFRDRMFIFGGMDANWQWRNDVWHSN